ncbi:MAG TPA: hypothetical protein VNQ32_10885 [Steroidobacteraceae bacterium]|nr:hypothetical protein [Steroidobacteraceae bacterium]
MASRKPTTRQGMILFAKSKKRISAFYQSVLGLRAVESEPSHDLLQAVGVEIVVHAIPRKIAAAIKITKPPRPRESAVIKPTFVVKSLKRVREVATKAGGSLRPDSEAWSFRGFIVIDGMDPEGNQLQFKQRVA